MPKRRQTSHVGCVSGVSREGSWSSTVLFHAKPRRRKGRQQKDPLCDSASWRETEFRFSVLSVDGVSREESAGEPHGRLTHPQIGTLVLPKTGRILRSLHCGMLLLQSELRIEQIYQHTCQSYRSIRLSPSSGLCSSRTWTCPAFHRTMQRGGAV